jgi:hypothetical protein
MDALRDLSDAEWPSMTLISCIGQTDRYNLEIGWLYYLAEIATKRIRSNVWIERYKTQAADISWDLQLEKRVVEFERQIQEWYQALPVPMKFPINPSIPAQNIMRYILRGHMLDISEDVRFPAIQATLGTSSSSQNLTNLVQFPPTIIGITRDFLANAANRIEANREGSFHRHHGTWLGLRCCSRSALQLLGMACKCHLDGAHKYGEDLERQLLPPGWKDAVQLVLTSVEYWSAECADIQRMWRILSELLRVYQTLSRMTDAPVSVS